MASRNKYHDSDPDGEKPSARFVDMKVDGQSVRRVYWSES
jgi:hypothetical protein